MTRVSFERSLERCLRELACTGDVETSLRRYPRYADRLRPLLEMAQATRRYYEAVPAAPGRLAAGRERLLAVAARQRARGISAAPASRARTRRTGTRKLRFALATRVFSVALVVLVGAAALGGAVIWAAGDSLPGGSLYPVKLATEDARLALAAAPGKQVDLALQFVEERAQEVRALVEAGQQVPDDTIARMERHIERALTQAAWAPDAQMAGLLMRIAECTRAQVQALEQAQALVSQQARPGLERAVAVCRRGMEAAEDGLADPRAFRWRYRHRQGTPEPTNEPEQVTATPQGDREPEQEQHQRQDQERERTPVATPRGTPQGPQPTPSLQATPQGGQATPVPQATPHAPQPTPTSLQATPQAPQWTVEPPAATPRPRAPGDGRNGDRQAGDGHGGGGQGDAE